MSDTAIDNLKLRRRSQEDQTVVPGTGVSLGRSGAEDYWSYRVDLTDSQAVIGFPKHWTIGVDFLHNDGSDLPYSVEAERLADFMASGRLMGGDENILRAHVLRAIQMIRDAVVEDDPSNLTCSGKCQIIRNKIHWGEMSADDDPTKDFEPHWIEDCPLFSERDMWMDYTGDRDQDGWPIRDEDEEED